MLAVPLLVAVKGPCSQYLPWIHPGASEVIHLKQIKCLGLGITIQ